MKTFMLAAALLTLESLLPRIASAADTPPGHYCNMGVFTATSLKRHQELVVELMSAMDGRRELPNGYAFKFSGRFAAAGEWLDGVRRCCPTLDYQVDFERQAGTAWLRVTGDAGAKEFIRNEFHQLVEKKI